MIDPPYKKFVIYGTNRIEHNKFLNRLLSVKMYAYDPNKDQFTARMDDVQPFHNKSGGEENTKEVMVRGPNGIYMPVTEFQECVQHGCMNCAETFTEKDAENVFLTDGDDPQPICEECVGLWNFTNIENKVH